MVISETLIASDEEDKILMLSYQKSSDEKAYDNLYRKYSPKLYGYLSKKIKCEEDIREIFQNVFLKLHKCKHQYNPNYKFCSWFFSIAYSSMIDFLRKKREIPFEQIDYLPDLNNNELSTYNIVNLLESINMSEEARSAIKLKFIDRQGYDQIAIQLGMKNSAVRQRKALQDKKCGRE